MRPRPAALFASHLILFASLACAGETPLDASKYIRPDEIRAGMRGYALTVIRGTEPERFEIEVLGRLRKMMPGQDIILIRCDDEKLARTGVAQGMSGSPVFINTGEGEARLLGALAYSWSFQNEPIAGVTPITNMMAGLDSNTDIDRDARGDAVTFDAEDLVARLTSPLPAARRVEPILGELRPVATPLMVSGVPPRLMAELEGALSPFGLTPVQGGLGAADGEEDKRPFRPGDAIGVQLMRGDSNWTAIGTVTHVEGSYVLAFGHPFLQAGPWQAPVTRAHVEWILSRNSTSFKLATPTGTIGTLVDDIRSCIIAKLGPAPEMVPLEVSVSGPGRTATSFKYEVVQHPNITAILAFYAAVDSVDTAYPWRDDATIRVRSKIRMENHGVLEVDTLEPFTSSAGSALGRSIGAILSNPFKRVKIEDMHFDVRIEPGRRTASIMSVKSPYARVKAGTDIDLRVRVRPFGSDDEEIEIKVHVPEELKGKQMSLRMEPAGRLSPDVAPPRNFDDYLRIVEAVFEYPETSMAVTIEAQTRGLRSEGRVMPALPSSVMNVLVPAGSNGPSPSKDFKHLLFDTKWVLSGSTSIELDVIE